MGAGPGKCHPPHVVVVGDAILDRCIRTSGPGRGRESGVPSLSVQSTESAAGGAANAAVSTSRLGGRTQLAAVVGRDEAGAELLRILGRHHVGTGLVTFADRPTAVKTRVYQDQAQVLRLDSGLGQNHPDVGPADRLWSAVHAAPDALLVSDYGYGTLGDGSVRRFEGRRPPVLVVDARRLERWRHARPDLATCDETQARRICGDLPADPRSVLERTASDLLAASGAAAVAVTLGPRGAVLLRPHRPAVWLPAPEVADGEAVGSGDVFAASTTLALATGLDLPEAVEAAVATATAATATALAQRRTAVAALPAGAPPRRRSSPSRDTDDGLGGLASWAAAQHRRGARIVFAGGCFDLVHEGHVVLLTRARELGDVLVVAVNDDASVRALKGPDRPVVDLAGRMQVLRALSCVDHVASFSGPSPAAALEAVRPHVFVKGSDYSPETLPEAELLARMGVDVRFIDVVPDRSTTHLLDRVRTTGT